MALVDHPAVELGMHGPMPRSPGASRYSRWMRRSIDGAIVAVDSDDLPSFKLLQDFGSAAAILFHAFDLSSLGGLDFRDQPL